MPNSYWDALKGLAGFNQPAPDYSKPDPASSVQLARLQLQGSMPEEERSMGSLKPMNVVDRMMLPKGTQAVAFPSQNVRFNPSMISNDQSEVNDMLSHELTHVGQWNRPGAWGEARRNKELPYMDRPEEHEARDTVARRLRNRQDVVLPDESLPTFSMKGR